MGDWRTFKFTVDVSAGVVGIKDALEDDAAGARVSFMYLVEDTVGCVIESADFGDEAVLVYHAEKIMVPKALESTDVFLPGDRVYWDPTARIVTPTYDSGYYWIGIATEPAVAADLYVEIDLKGDHAEVEAAL
jgi:hypothetical protein